MVHYGPHNDAEFLFNYGFALRRNAHDQFSLGTILPEISRTLALLPDPFRTLTAAVDTGAVDTGAADTGAADNGLREQASGLANSFTLTAAEPLEATRNACNGSTVEVLEASRFELPWHVLNPLVVISRLMFPDLQPECVRA